jgi:CRISPR/Cas system CMR-associated protein Cmr5 small subunit
MQNLEQIRARNALKFASEYGHRVTGSQGGEVIKKLPPHILNHGLLATAAYSFTEKEGWQLTFDAIARHLADKDIAIVPDDKVKDRSTLMDFLTHKDTTSEVLKHATAETMAWLQYARRFVKPEKGANRPNA